MLQSEENGKQMMIQGQLQMVVLFIDAFKPKTIDGSGSSGNWLKLVMTIDFDLCLHLYEERLGVDSKTPVLLYHGTIGWSMIHCSKKTSS